MQHAVRTRDSVLGESVSERTPCAPPGAQSVSADCDAASQLRASWGSWFQGVEKPAGLCGAVFAGEATQAARTGAGRPVHTLHWRQNTHLASSSERVDFERHVQTPKPGAVSAELWGGA